MAGGMDIGGPTRGGKKPLDVAINLVPFIDLMAVTIAFLIMTAVWTQIGRIEVPMTGPGKADAEAIPLSLAVAQGELRLTYGDDTQVFFDIPALGKHLATLHASSINIRPDDDIQYEALVHVIDACLDAQITGVSVTP